MPFRTYLYTLFILLCLFSQAISRANSTDVSGTILLTIKTNGTTCEKANGSIIVTASGGTAPYKYSCNGNVQDNGIFIRLNAGTYTIEVTDADGDKAVETVILTNTYEAPTGVSSSIIGPSDCTAKDASISLTGIGGTPPYTYSIDKTNYQVSNHFPNLNAGLYHCAVRDANGCVSPQIWYDYTLINENCSMEQHGLSLTYVCDPFRSQLGLIGVSGGTAPYSYSLDGINFQSDYLFDGLPAGLYTVTVKDATNKLFLYSGALVDWCNPYLFVNAISQASNCNGSDGSIAVTAVDGISPYLYSIDGINFQDENLFTGLPTNDYTVYVKDATNLIASKLVRVENTCFSITATPVNSSCGKENGSIEITPTGGIAPYTYSIDDISYSTVNKFTNLAAGSYGIWSKDASGKKTRASVTINDIEGPKISVSSNPADCSNANGSINIMATGGTMPLLYKIGNGNFQTTANFVGLPSNNYAVEVKDANGCIATTETKVALINDLVVEAGDEVTLCEGMEVQLKGKSNGGNFSWAPSSGLNNPNHESPIAKPSVTTKYYLTATLNACSTVDSVIVTVKPAPIANAGENIIICPGKNIQLKGTGGVAYKWTPSTYLSGANVSSPVVILPTETTSYQLSVIDANGCRSVMADTVTVIVTPPPKIFAGKDTSILIGQSMRLSPIDINNVGFSQYSWYPSLGLNNSRIENPVATPSASTSYILTASTAEGCTAKDTINIKVFKRVDILVPTAFTPNGDGRNDILKSIPIGIKDFLYFNIYDRWGGIVFRTTDPDKGWDGKMNGVLKETGVYVWLTSGVDYEGKKVTKKGTTLLTR